jgi:hypothetical protein
LKGGCAAGRVGVLWDLDGFSSCKKHKMAGGYIKVLGSEGVR